MRLRQLQEAEARAGGPEYRPKTARPADSPQTGDGGEDFAGDVGRWPGRRAAAVAGSMTLLLCRKATTAGAWVWPVSDVRGWQRLGQGV